VCVGQLLKQHATQHEDALSKEVQACMHAGTLVPTPVVVSVLTQCWNGTKGPVLLDGFPRVHEQMDVVDKLGCVAGVLFLDCPEDVMISRMDKTDCDDEIALLAQFTEHCLPCLDLYERAGLLHVVGAAQGIEEVQAALQSTIRAL
jgi:adenylate kinase family enzyme